MSDKKWYEDLSYEDFFDWHVNVRLLNGTTIYGPLLACDTHVDVDMCGESYRVLERNNVHSAWGLATCVTSVDKVWSNREWKRIDVKDVKENDAIVVNGRLLHITEVGAKKLFVKEQTVAIPSSAVSQALRYISMPKTQGFYESDSEDVFYLANDSEWWMIEDDGIAHLTLPPTDFLPLFPIHFELGEADYE